MADSPVTQPSRATDSSIVYRGALNERHLNKLLSEYVGYYHEDRTHLGLAKDTPIGRPTKHRHSGVGTIVAHLVREAGSGIGTWQSYCGLSRGGL